MLTVDEIILLAVFPKVIESECVNIRRIHPLKQAEVSKIYEYVKKNQQINKVIIFGSSVTMKCDINSDLDIVIDVRCSDTCMEIYDINKTIGEICDWNCDILMYSKLGSRLRQTVDNEGVVIYESSY